MLGKKTTLEEIEEVLKIRKEKKWSYKKIGERMNRSDKWAYGIINSKIKPNLYPNILDFKNKIVLPALEKKGHKNMLKESIIGNKYFNKKLKRGKGDNTEITFVQMTVDLWTHVDFHWYYATEIKNIPSIRQLGDAVGKIFMLKFIIDNNKAYEKIKNRIGYQIAFPKEFQHYSTIFYPEFLLHLSKKHDIQILFL